MTAGGFKNMEPAAAILVQAMLESAPNMRTGLTAQLQQNPQAGADFLRPYLVAAMRALKKVSQEN